ncbi:SID1 transmembrane family member 1-like [Artemia franciscana]|uniref:SID1 transmembrane family member 1-like n=1 Tax=Artemia franciscana TaxID=6661 RepID=UPI0032DA7154
MERKPGDSVLYVVLFVTLFIHYPVHGLIQMPRSLRLKDEHQVHTEVIEASCDHLYRESTNRTLEFIYHFVHANESSKAVRISVDTKEVTQEHPILFVVRQQKSVSSWQLPHFIDTASGIRAYHRVRRTLCPEDLEVSNASEELEFVVGVSTSDPRNVSFTIEATKIDDFLIKLDEERNIIVSPSEPEFYQYVFDENVTAVLVNVTSPDDLCMTVSVQNLTCPSFGRDEEMRYDSIRQTALDRSGLTITKEKFPNGFYLVFSVKADDYECSGKKDQQVYMRRKRIMFRITEKLKPSQFYTATLGVIGIFMLFYILGVFIWIVHCITSGPAPPLERSLLEAEDSQRYGTASSLDRPIFPVRSYEGRLIDSFGSRRHITASGSVSGNNEIDSKESSLNEEEIDMLEDAYLDKDVFRTKTFLYVSDLARKDHKFLSKRFYSYIWQLLTLSTFYALPVIQLVITYQKVKLDEERNIIVSPSEPEFYQYVFDENVTAVLVNVTSPDDLCMTVSVQNLTCPSFGRDEEMRYDSIRQTALDRSGLTITKEKFPNGFYLVFSVKADDYECSGKKDQQVYMRRKRIMFRITEKLKPSQFYTATLGVIGIFMLFYILGVFIWIVHCITSGPAPPLERSLLEAEDSQRYGTASSLDRPIFPVRSYEGRLIDSFGSRRHITASGSVSGNNEIDSKESSLNEEEIDMLEDAYLDKDVFRTKTFLYVSDLARKDHKFLSKRFYSYIWQLLTLSTFYALPVIQLVITYQKVLNDTGDQDLCYYNFLCAHPFGKLTDFNHVFSNVGYVMLGILFCILVFFRDVKHKHMREKNNKLEKYYGIPQFYGLFYAMGVSLILEGVMSACYHICPTHANYQFDTTFMYVIAILCMLKIYQTRHPDIVATAQASFGILAFVVIAGVISVYESSIYFWVIYTILHLMGCLALSASIYYMGRWKLDFGIFKRIYLTWLNDIRAGFSHCFRPMYPDRMILLAIGNLFNWALAAYGLHTQPPDFASYQLAIFITNLMLYTLFYIVMKIRYGETVLVQPLIYICLSLVSWGASFYFFIIKAATWRMSAAESRHYNQECLILNFYDYHDVWHFLSASSMFFSFMILLSLDDDQVYRPRDKIPVF